MKRFVVGIAILIGLTIIVIIYKTKFFEEPVIKVSEKKGQSIKTTKPSKSSIGSNRPMKQDSPLNRTQKTYIKHHNKFTPKERATSDAFISYSIDHRHKNKINQKTLSGKSDSIDKKPLSGKSDSISEQLYKLWEGEVKPALGLVNLISGPKVEERISKFTVAADDLKGSDSKKQKEFTLAWNNLQIKALLKTVQIFTGPDLDKSVNYYVGLAELLETQVLQQDMSELLNTPGDWHQISEQIENNQSEISKALKRKLSRINLLNSSKEQSSHPYKYRDNIIDELTDLDDSNFNSFYVFDEFKDSCSHGEKVVDVIKQVLNAYKLDSAIKKVVKIPVNYFSNIEFGDSVYNEWRTDQDELHPEHLVDSVTKRLYKDNDGYSPPLYLRAIYTIADDLKPDIITSSYTADADIPFIQSSFSRDNKITNYFAAALNKDMDIESFMEESERSAGQPSSEPEPLKSYFTRLAFKGAIIVGNQTGIDKFEGMFSSQGANISVVGKGNHWGLKDCTSCIDSLKDNGTSFATPEAATKMFIAKAFWKKNKLNIDALEARNRMILATNLTPAIVGKFASGGTVNLRKLIQTSKGYLVTKSDSVIAIDSVYHKVSISYEEQLDSKQIYFSSSKIQQPRGLYVEDGKTYIFRNAQVPKWELVPKPSDLSLIIQINGRPIPQVFTIDEFYKTYKQIVLLK